MDKLTLKYFFSFCNIWICWVDFLSDMGKVFWVRAVNGPNKNIKSKVVVNTFLKYKMIEKGEN